VPLHPLQAAEQERIAAMTQNMDTAIAPTPAPAESVKDMSPATRRVLESLADLLKDARQLNPNEAPKPGRAEIPSEPGATPKPARDAALPSGETAEASAGAAATTVHPALTTP